MGIDFETLIILAVLAFVLFGPEKLPQYAAKAGYYLAKLREASTELTRQAQSSFPNPLQASATPTQPASPESTPAPAAADQAAPAEAAPPPATPPAQAAAALAAGQSTPPQPVAGEPTPVTPSPAPAAAGRPTCTTCNQMAEPGFSFCPYCGCRLNHEAAPAPSRQPLAS